MEKPLVTGQAHADYISVNLTKEMMSLTEQLRREALRRGLSQRTIKTYCFCVEKFLSFFRNKELKCITKKEVQEYFDCFVDRGKPGNTINVHLNAVKFFFEQVLRKRLTVNIAYSKIPKRLPEFLTGEEIVHILESISNPKHKLMIALLYATGMRVGELVSLKVRDFEFNQNYGWVRQGKGRKDRPFIIPQKLKSGLLGWIEKQKLGLDDWLFTGYGRNHISSATIQQIIKDAARKAKIFKHVHPHTMRHSFATHLIQNGYGVTEVQPLLGHSSLQTTMIYLHMAAPELLKVKSPYDALNNLP